MTEDCKQTVRSGIPSCEFCAVIDRERDELRACLEWFMQGDRGFGADEALRRFREKSLDTPSS